jgi:hypothetical protein
MAQSWHTQSELVTFLAHSKPLMKPMVALRKTLRRRRPTLRYPYNFGEQYVGLCCDIDLLRDGAGLANPHLQMNIVRME